MTEWLDGSMIKLVIQSFNHLAIFLSLSYNKLSNFVFSSRSPVNFFPLKLLVAILCRLCLYLYTYAQSK